ncbi:MAG: Nickel transporter UreH [Gemmatimonadetes bacterium]|nr:Nickel transporter UreH [Gemmatimonadota bacterium]
MFSLAGALSLGFILGMRHATDPDHVVAVTTIVSQSQSLRRAGWIGALWGLGHSATILLLGGAIVLFRVVIPPRVGLAMEFAVAVMLVVLGVLAVTGRGAAKAAAVSTARPLVVGFVHGLAGSAFVAMLVLAAIPSPVAGMLYLALFCAGTIVGMTVITAAMAVPAAYGAARVAGARRHIQLAAGVASVVFGLFLAHEVGVTQGLFGTTPHWTPK